MRRALAVLPVWVWLIGFVALPAVLIAVMAFAVSADSVPPFRVGFSPTALISVFSDPYYLGGFLFSLEVAALSAAFCLLLGYPMALAIARSAPRHRRLLLLLVILPFWTGFLLRITAWIGILRDDGLLNAVLGFVGLPSLRLLHTDTAMLIGMVYGYLPFMILPIEARLSAADRALEQAAADLGASPLRVFLSVTLPLSLPGVWAGLALVFVPVVGEYVIPDLLGGPGSLTIGRVIYEEFFQNNDWPQAAALALVLLLGLALPASLVRRR
ncbi:MAG TPA: ABC transporter permease [Rhodopila sp.]|nr:ABC transporter permease [Rhodopila sp.]